MALTETLYRRLGGTEGIRSIVDDVMTAHMENPTIRPRFLRYVEDPHRLALVKQHLYTFIEAGTGGPAAYQGRTMKDAHSGMNISAGEYLAVVDDIMVVLRRHGIDEQTQRDMLAIAYSLKDDIMYV